jgi:DNA polymerase-4
VLHVDMDAFFASVEQLDHPEWRGRPVIVGGSPDRRGVVATASYEARRYGVRSAMPAARAARLLPADAIWTRGNFDRYSEVSHQVFEVLHGFSPDVQVASIDEAYLDVTPGVHAEHPLHVAELIQTRVDRLGVTCSIGLATSKTVAKIASDQDKPRGLTVVWPGQEAAFLAPLPIGRMPGVGPATAARLRSLGIALLGDLAALDDATAAQILGAHGPDAARRASGIDARRPAAPTPAKSVSNERTFASDIRGAAELEAAVGSLAERVAVRLRRAGLRGRTVHLKVRFADFTTTTIQETLKEETDATREVRHSALNLLRMAWTPGVGVRLLGVGLSGFGEGVRQLDLLEGAGAGASAARDDALEHAIDSVRARFGDGAIQQGRTRPDHRSEAEGYGPTSDAESRDSFGDGTTS